MLARESAPSEEHQKLVGFLVDWIIAEGCMISCASYASYPRCEAIDGDYIPDAIGYRSDIELACFGESETAETIDTEHTKRQFRKFADRIMKEGKSKGKMCPFYITIPKGSEEVLKAVLRELSLLDKAHVMWRSFQA
jgi:hypothetical protein